MKAPGFKRWFARLHRVKDDRPQRLCGIVEADEMFMRESQKGSRQLDRPARKRGGAAGRRGISRELDCILVARCARCSKAPRKTAWRSWPLSATAP